MRAAWFGAGALFFALSGCTSTQTTGFSGAATSGGQGSGAGPSGGSASVTGTSGGQGSSIGTSGGQTTGASNPCASVICKPTFICVSDGGCIEDPCFGVSCTAPGAACYGGECKCGGPDGVLCSAPGESCNPIDNSCSQATGCAVTSCPTNEVCNAQDSACHCGTMSGAECGPEPCTLYLVDGGPLAPGQDAGGAAVYGMCSSNGDPCHNVTCPPFQTCDENNDGACECGGAPDMNIPGTVCMEDESCVDPFDGGAATCLQNCQPFGAPCPAAQVPDASMPVAQDCIYFPAVQVTVCAPPAGDAGAAYCDVFPDGGPTSKPPPDGGTHACDAGSVCTPLPAGIIAGTCEPE